MTLHVLATPIGNLSDASPRLRATLEGAGLVLAEDTRRVRKLCSALGIAVSAPVVSSHGWNEAGRVPGLLEALGQGKDVVVVSDAGTPCLSDPGTLLVDAAHRQGFPVRAVPGPSAIMAALSVSGFDVVSFSFHGFPPRKGKDRAALLQEVMTSSRAAVLFEAPGRTVRLLEDLAELDGDRVVCLCREITKLHEEIIRASLDQMAQELAQRDMRGEVTLVLAPKPGAASRPPTQEEGEEPVGQAGAAQALARAWGLPRGDVYRALTRLRRELRGEEEDPA